MGHAKGIALALLVAFGCADGEPEAPSRQSAPADSASERPPTAKPLQREVDRILVLEAALHKAERELTLQKETASTSPGKITEQEAKIEALRSTLKNSRARMRLMDNPPASPPGGSTD